MHVTHRFSVFPILKLAEEVLRPCRELEFVSETKKTVDTVEEVE